MRRLFAGLLLAALLPLSGAVTRTGQNSVKIPLAPGNVRISCPECTVIIPSSDKTVCNSGCDYTPAQLASTAISGRVAGDILEGRTATPGATETWATNFVCNGTDGASGNPIVFRIRSGDHIKFRTTGTMLSFTNCDYWVIAGDANNNTALSFGDGSEYHVASYRTTYTHTQTSECINSTWIALKNLTLTGSRTYYNNEWLRSCDYVVWSNINAAPHGATNNGTGDWGDWLHMEAQHFRLEESNLINGIGGHSSLEVVGPYPVIRNNTLSGNWESYLPTGASARAISLAPANKDFWNPNTTNPTAVGPALMEGNLITIGMSQPNTADNCAKLYGYGLIVRGNFIYDCGAHAFQGAGYEDMHAGAAHSAPFTGHIEVYHNTLDNVNAVWRNQNSTWANPPLRDDDAERYALLNNVAMNVHTGSVSVWAVDFDGRTIPLDNFANSWKGFRGQGNIFGGNSANMQWNLRGTSGAATRTITDATTWPSNISNNQNTNLLFANGTATPASHTRAGMTLLASNSIGVNDASALTTVTSTTDSTHMVLADARLFSDGWGMTFGAVLGNGLANEPSDWIAVTPASGGSATTAVCTRIASINYSSGAIVVSPAITRIAGSNVWFAGNGDSCTVWANRGANQTTTTLPVAVADGAIYTVNGSGFGTNTANQEWLGGKDGVIDSGTNGSDFTRTNWVKSFSDISRWTYDTTHILSRTKALLADNGFPGPAIDGRKTWYYDFGASGITQEYFSTNYYVDSGVATTFQFKIRRLTHDPPIEVDGEDPSWYYSTWLNGPSTFLNVYNQATGNSRYFGDGFDHVPLNEWFRMEHWWTVNTPAGTANGTMRIRVTQTSTGTVLYDHTFTGINFRGNSPAAPVHRWAIFQNYLGNAVPANTRLKIYMDDIYMSSVSSGTGTKHVELCEGATYSPTAKCALEKWTTWSDAQITLPVNKGPLADLNNKFFYVFGATGTVINSAGIALQ